MALFAGWLADRVPIRIIGGGSYVGLACAICLMLVGRNGVFFIRLNLNLWPIGWSGV